MALRIRFQYPTGSSLGFSIERLADGLLFDFADGTFKAAPGTPIVALPEDAGNFAGRYKENLAPTPVAQFLDGHYTITVHDLKAANAVVAELGATMRNGDDLGRAAASPQTAPDPLRPVFATPIDGLISTLATAHVAGSGALNLVDATRLGQPTPAAPVRLTVLSADGSAVLGQFLATAAAGPVVTATVDAGFTDAALPAGALVAVTASAAALAELQAAMRAMGLAVADLSQVPGPAGAVGPIGPPGPQGATGPAGVAGPQGAVGPAGVASTVPGPAGPQGPQGAPGPTGATGPQGPAGSGGSAAPAGASGQVQLNGGGTFSADAALVWDEGNKRLGIGTATPTCALDLGTGLLTGGTNSAVNRNYIDLSSDSGDTYYSIAFLLGGKKFLATYNEGKLQIQAAFSGMPFVIENYGAQELRLGTGSTSFGVELWPNRVKTVDAPVGGGMRFFDGSGNVLASFDSVGAPHLPILTDAAAQSGALYLGSDHPDANGDPKLCRKGASGTVVVLG